MQKPSSLFATRRAFLGTAAAGAVAAALPRRAYAADAGWEMVPSILARIRPPGFPQRDFDITTYGAKSDGSNSTDAIRKAIEECANSGGGRVVVPAGEFHTGAIHLGSNMNLHVSEGATLKFIFDEDLYPLVYTRWEGTECINTSPFIYAFEQANVGLTGTGTIDGQATRDTWLGLARGAGGRGGGGGQGPARNRLMEMGARNVPVSMRVFGKGRNLRPNFVQFLRCTNVLIEDVTVLNSPMWEIHPALSQNVTVRGLKINSHGGNNDGVDPESCRDVLIENCLFDTGDDCIAIKSGRNRDGRRVGVACENIIVRNCQMKDGHGGVTIGSEASGSVRNVFAEDNVMDSPNLDRALRLKTNSVRGGAIENIYMRNCTVGQVAEGVLSVDLTYEEGDRGEFPPTVRNIEMRNVTSQKSRYALYLRGYEHTPLRDIRLIDCTFHNAAQADVIEHVEGLKYENFRVNGELRSN